MQNGYDFKAKPKPVHVTKESHVKIYRNVMFDSRVLRGCTFIKGAKDRLGKVTTENKQTGNVQSTIKKFSAKKNVMDVQPMESLRETKFLDKVTKFTKGIVVDHQD